LKKLAQEDCAQIIDSPLLLPFLRSQTTLGWDDGGIVDETIQSGVLCAPLIAKVG
jgi:hypothetical protein